MANLGSFSPATRFVLTLAALVIIIAGLKSAQSLIVPFLLASFIAIILLGPLEWLESNQFPHWAAVVTIAFIVMVIILTVTSMVGDSIEQFRQALPHYQSRINHEVIAITTTLKHWGIPASENSLRQALSFGGVMKIISNLLGSLGGVLAHGFLILLTVVFLLAEAPSISNKFRISLNNPEPFLSNYQLFAQSVKRYMTIKTIISALSGIVIAVFLAILGVEFFILWGLLVCLLNFVPGIGAVLAAIPAVLLAFIEIDGNTALLVAAGYLIVNLMVSNVIEPRFMGKEVGLSTLVIFLSLIVWGWILGPMGMLLCVPLTLMAKIALEQNPETAWIAVLLGNSDTNEYSRTDP